MAGVVERNLPRLFPEDGEDPSVLSLSLQVVDREIITELSSYPVGPARDELALRALRIGILALRQARGQLDADLIQRETQRMLSGMETQLQSHSRAVQDRLETALKEYFDPQSGRLAERVQRLVSKDGELETVLRSHIGGQDSELCRTLLNHVGSQSPLMKLLSPTESQGLMGSFRELLGEQLQQQRDRVLTEFSLDKKDSALARLVNELTEKHGHFTRSLQDKIAEVVREFSLDQEDSALSRLVRNVEGAQQTISKEFSLDNGDSAFSRLKSMLENTGQTINKSLTLDDETSALARLRKELIDILNRHTRDNSEFQEEVKVSLARLQARKEEAKRSTQHGVAFEDAACEFLALQSQARGELFSRTGSTTGLIKNCKKGDAVIELGPESAAPGARIVIEAKERVNYSLVEGRAEIEEARKNRDAQVGLFIFSRRTAPAGMEEVQRIGNDVFVLWDAEDAASDLQLKVAVTLARALSLRVEQQRSSQVADFDAIGAAILEVERQAGFLSDVVTWGETIKQNADKILKRVAVSQKSLESQVEKLQELIDDLKATLGKTGS